MGDHSSQPMNGHTSGPWTVSDVRSVEGEYLVVGGAGQDFGLIASCPEKSDAELIASVPSLKARIEELLEYEKAAAKLRGFSECTCMGRSRESEQAYETGQCPHQKARATLASKGGVK